MLSPAASNNISADKVASAINTIGAFLPNGGNPTNEGGDSGNKDADDGEGELDTALCKKHNVPQNFWSNKEQIYQCIKCLINDEEVHFIDTSYKRTLEEFRAIKKYAKFALNENAPMACLIHEWKDDIRDMLQRVNAQFVQMITEFTRRFFNSLIKVEYSEKMQPFQGEDSRQNARLEFMKEKYESITKIIEDIDATAPNLKANAVSEIQEQMRKLELDLIQKDKEMKKVNQRAQRAMTETVDLNPLSERIFNKYIKYIDNQVQIKKNELLVPKSKTNHPERKLYQNVQDLSGMTKSTIQNISSNMADSHPEIVSTGTFSEAPVSMQETTGLTQSQREAANTTFGDMSQ